MDGVQLPQGYRATTRKQFTFYNWVLRYYLCSTSEGWQVESTLEPPSDFEHDAPGLKSSAFKYDWAINIY